MAPRWLLLAAALAETGAMVHDLAVDTDQRALDRIECWSWT